ncbi:hypothetical protein Esti_002196 [Eimeria stiedai]
MVKEEAIRRGLHPVQPDGPLKRRKAQKHAPSRVSPAAQHSAQPSPTASSQPEVLERFHTALGTDREASPIGDPTEVLGAAPAVVPPAIEAGPPSQQPSTPPSSSGVGKLSTGPPSQSKMQLTQQLSPVTSTVASIGKRTLMLAHNAKVEASQPVLAQPQTADSSGQQQPATLATQGGIPHLHKQLLSRKHQTLLKQFLYERNQLKLLGSLKTLSKLKTIQYTLSEALKLRTYWGQLHLLAGVPRLAVAPSDEPDPVHWEQFFFDFKPKASRWTALPKNQWNAL